MSLDLTTFDAALKQHYLPIRVENMVYKENPLLAMLAKYESFGGKNMPIPLTYANPQNRSSTFATAQAGATTSKHIDFVITRTHDYSLAFIDNETIEASQGNSNAFMEAVTSEIDNAFHSITRSLAVSLYGTGGGSIGRVANGSFAGTTLTLVNTEDVTNFEVGMILKTDAVDGTGTENAGELSVVAVNRDSGAVELSGALSTWSGVATNDYIFQKGDYGQKIKGLQAWIPAVAPTGGDNFFSVDRSVDATRLAGIRIDGSALPIEEALVKASARLAREGGRPDVVYMGFSKYQELVNSLGSKVQYIEHKVGEIGFEGVMVHGPKSKIKVIPDTNCPSDKAFMLTMNTWKLYSLKKAPRILDTDGLKMLRQGTADGVEVRIGYYAQVACQAPGMNAVITF